ncbi:hypothetical protein E0H73_43740 [Kribbella pittospori]|uniref:Uncharacterized protein n=1 Tax=Kribbella pittospori TaxID=722689 RepID=A0A4R0JK40_9ACTN|nr:hypothetical protein [Kribbella pittospori]TCC46979.1 hypothetical protein E0H73_43740 [Kribbella pittospori]
MFEGDDHYSVHVLGRSWIEYKDRERTVRLRAGMLDQEVYLGQDRRGRDRLVRAEDRWRTVVGMPMAGSDVGTFDTWVPDQDDEWPRPLERD